MNEIENIFKKYFDEYVVYNNDNTRLFVNVATIGQFRQAIAEYEKSKWVSVDMRLPDLGVKVITDSGDGHYNIASFYTDQNRWVNVSGHTLSHVIKWSKIL